MNEINDIFGDISFDDADILEADADEKETETEVPEADQQTESGEGQNGNKNTQERTEESADQSFVLKYLGAEKAVSRDEVITLAQKGMDYDRIHGKYTEGLNALKEANEKISASAADMSIADTVKQLAQANGMSVDDFIQRNFAAIAAAKNGTDIDTELPKIRLDFERKAFEKQKSDWEKNRDSGVKPDDADSEMKAEIAEFEKLYPEAAKDAAAIPKEVWDAKNADPNRSLAQHYRDHLYKQKDAEIADLKARLEKAQQSAENKRRSTGSLDGSGSGAAPDIWDIAWAEATK